ncbi:polysaccharide biosynthesis tyrosine autokinase [Massilia violaceinigra]|uniref:Polysaccharide biosynthesis tyrosine autokinase n=1 Tax=Massilia violaceinigra TaxID=2045208 RepID=A0ABY4A751_9BURK|nr:polysaccharide biosynthesis tyrosine autokinase [Massilia violaceinigra]UOD28478.1 polysaccharide biosynthesis tyrosine autokinase [Massilia violaceinigra]
MNYADDLRPMPAPRPLPVPSLPPPAPPPGREPEAHEIDLQGYVNILYDSRWLIGAVTAVVTMLAIIYALVASPVYEANLMIHVEEESPNASKNILSEVSSLFETKKAAIAEMELLRSRLVVSHAVDNLQLFVDVRPRYFPVVGFWFADRKSNELTEPGIFGRGGYVWGPEKAEVSLFEVPEAWYNRTFTLTAQGKGRYHLSGGGLPTAYEGVVGTTLRASVAGAAFELRVDRLRALPGAQFRLTRSSRLAAIERIQTALVITEQGKQSGIIEVRLQGPDAQRINSLLGEIGREYMRQNLARKTEEAEKSLAFLNLQLPALKRQLEESEEKYNGFRNSKGSIDMREEARISLQQAAAAQTRRLELEQKKTELLQRFTENHPIVQGINQQRREVEAEIAEVARRIRTLPVLEQDESRLLREIKVNTDLYTALSNTAQQLRLISVGRVSNVRLIDAPMAPERALKPNRPLIVALAVVTGLFLGVLLAFARKAFVGGIDNPQRIETILGARIVYASIPHSIHQDKLERKARGGSVLPILAQVAPEDIAIESLRSFRAALMYTMPSLKNNIVMLAGPGRAMGKSFLSVNFAAVLAASGKRVLLIDADLRNGHLHRYFGISRERGLTQAIGGAQTIDEVIHRGVLDNLDVIPTGALPPNRSEFLQHPDFSKLLEVVGSRYDIVLIDPPPILAVSDALMIGAHAGAVFILARAGVTTAVEITESIKRLNHAGIVPQGVLFNDMALRVGSYAYQFKYTQVPQLEQ